MAKSDANSDRAYDERPRPLAGVRVVDFTWIVAGPQATRILADLGADVIRVENEGHMDSLRGGLPPDGDPHPDRSGIFNNFNRNKRGITANIYHPRTRELIEQLISGADAVTENFSPGAFARMGFSFERLRELNPKIIYLSLSGYGHYGRDSSYVTWGPTAQAVSGLTYISGLPDQDPAGWGYSYLDHSAGYYGAIAMLLALRRRERIEGAQRIDISQVETGMVMTGVTMLDCQINGRPSERIGNRSRHPAMAPHGAYRCAGDDRWITVAVESEEHWRELCEELGAPELADDERFASLDARLAAEDALDAAITECTRERDARQLMYALQARGVPAGLAQNMPDKMQDEQLAARGFHRAAPSPYVGDRFYEGLPFLFRQLGWDVRRGAPGLGEHVDEVLTELGCTPEEIAQLRAEAGV